MQSSRTFLKARDAGEPYSRARLKTVACRLDLVHSIHFTSRARHKRQACFISHVSDSICTTTICDLMSMGSDDIANEFVRSDARYERAQSLSPEEAQRAHKSIVVRLSSLFRSLLKTCLHRVHVCLRPSLRAQSTVLHFVSPSHLTQFASLLRLDPHFS